MNGFFSPGNSQSKLGLIRRIKEMRYDLTSVQKQGKVLDICWGGKKVLPANLNQEEHFKLCCITSRELERRDPLCVYVQGWWDSCDTAALISATISYLLWG